MNLEPNTLDFEYISNNIEPMLEAIGSYCVDYVLYRAGEKAIGFTDSNTSRRLGLRLNQRWRDVDRLLVGSTIIRSDGSANGPPLVLKLLQDFVANREAMR